MDIITADFETFYSQEYSLSKMTTSKMTTEEYIRDPRFQVIGVSTKVNDEPAVWVTGPKREILAHLKSLPFDQSMMLAQNTMFDGAILTWLCGIRPKALADTMLMSRALNGTEVGHSLAALSERYGKGKKGFEVLQAKGKRREDFTVEEMRAYGAYCINDSDLTYAVFKEMLQRGFPTKELRLIDITLRMFTDPVLELDGTHLRAHLKVTQTAKRDLIASIGGSTSEPLDSAINVAAKKQLMSNPKFATMLEALGVVCPLKISPSTGKETYAFAKGDEEFKALLDHDDTAVQALVSARMGVKSTLEETRTQRFIGIASRGSLPVPIRYYAAHTGRWGGCLTADTSITVLDISDAVVDKAITDVLPDDLVWDGIEFVRHEGVVFSGYSEVIEWDGVTGTEDHVVFTDAGEISLRDAMQGAHRITPSVCPDNDAMDAGVQRRRGDKI
jgi:DNA polymerase